MSHIKIANFKQGKTVNIFCKRERKKYTNIDIYAYFSILQVFTINLY